jgi:hypothetical protein
MYRAMLCHANVALCCFVLLVQAPSYSGQYFCTLSRRERFSVSGCLIGWSLVSALLASCRARTDPVPYMHVRARRGLRS